MDRRKYLKTLAVGSLSTGILLESCAPGENKKPGAAPPAGNQGGPDRQPHETAHYKKVTAETFFDAHELATLTVLVDIIIPKDETSGSATDAGVPAFLEFIVKDMPHHQVPLRGGLRWLDLQCHKRYSQPFVKASAAQQIEMVDAIAFPDLALPEHQQGVAFFNLLRDLTATGFYTSEIGIQDLGYLGNRPNQWDGVPQEVLDQYGMSYDPRTLDISVKYES